MNHILWARHWIDVVAALSTIIVTTPNDGTSSGSDLFPSTLRQPVAVAQHLTVTQSVHPSTLITQWKHFKVNVCKYWCKFRIHLEPLAAYSVVPDSVIFTHSLLTCFKSERFQPSIIAVCVCVMIMWVRMIVRELLHFKATLWAHCVLHCFLLLPAPYLTVNYKYLAATWWDMWLD